LCGGRGQTPFESKAANERPAFPTKREARYGTSLGLSLDKNLPANLINNFSLEQTLCDRRHARTLNAEKISDLLLRYGQNVVFISDVKRQQLIA